MKTAYSTQVKVWTGTTDECLIAVTMRVPVLEAKQKALEICPGCEEIKAEDLKKGLVLNGHHLNLGEFHYFIGEKNKLVINRKKEDNKEE